MKAIYTTILLFAAFSTSLLAQETRQLEAFTALEVGDAYEVILQKGSTHEARIEGDGEELERLQIETKGNTLVIERDGYSWRQRSSGRVTIYLTYTSLDEIEVSGASTLSAKETLNAKSLQLEVSGASTVTLQVDLNRLNAEVSGASTVRLSGTAQEHWIDVNGASTYSAGDLKATAVDIEASGASSAKVWAEEKIDARSYGASSVRYGGNPTNVDSDTSGAGSVKKM